MAGETRRSGRATKGQHRKNLEEEEVPAPKRQQKNKSKSAKPSSTEPEGEEDEEDEEEAIIRCICGANEDEEGWMMISCEQCTAWQHNLCMGITEVEENLPEAYYCEQCRPEDHAPLIAAMKRGEKPWEERIAKRRAEEKAAKAKKGKKGRAKGARASGAAEPVEASSTPTKSTPARSAAASVVPETGNKRKFDAVESSNGNGQVSPTAPSAPTATTPIAASADTRKSTGPEQQTKRAKSVSESAARRESLASPIPKVESLDQLPKERLPVAKALSTDLKGLVQKAVKDGSYKLQKGDAVDAIGLKLALDIEHAMYSLYKTTTGQYREQFLAVKFNMKKNQALVSQILSGALTPGELAEMSSDDMASEELQKERAAMKEEIDKQVILVEDSGPRYRKTHKGEELIGGDASKPEESTYTPPVRRLTLEHESVNRGPIDTGSPPPSAELPEDYDRPSGATDIANNSGSSNFNIQQVWKSVQSPDLSKPGQPKPARRQSSQQNQDSVMRDVADDPELDRLLKDEDDTAVSPTTINDPSALWQGRVHMANVGEFTAVARFAAGGDVGQKIPYNELIPEALEIDGRIAIQRANEYIGGMRYSQTTDVCTLSLSPIDTEVDRKGFGQIFNYFRAKERWGVIAQYKHQAIRDIYMVTVEAGMSPLPSFITMLEHSEIEELRPANLLLLTLVVRTRNPAPLPAPPITGQQATPINQNHPQFSPVSAVSSTFNVPHHAAPQIAVSPLAAQILGPFVHAPVVTQILGSVGDMSEVQLQNLRDILEREPMTRDDIAKLGMHLQQRQKEIGA